MTSTKRNVADELKSTRAKIAKLPTLDRQKWTAKLDNLQRRAAGAVSGTSRPGTGPAVPTVHHVVTLPSRSTSLAVVPKATKTVAPTTDWDLALANELDRIYQAVSDRATEVRKSVVKAVADDSAQVGWGLWPLAIAAVAIAWALGRRA